jgi:hypothetical protein
MAAAVAVVAAAVTIQPCLKRIAYDHPGTLWPAYTQSEPAMSEPKPYTLSEPKPYTLMYSDDALMGVISGGPIGGNPIMLEHFDTEEQAITRAEKLMTRSQGREFALYKDGKLLMAGSDFENYVRRREQQADD